MIRVFNEAFKIFEVSGVSKFIKIDYKGIVLLEYHSDKAATDEARPAGY
jgi:hypothetical protein